MDATVSVGESRGLQSRRIAFEFVRLAAPSLVGWVWKKLVNLLVPGRAPIAVAALALAVAGFGGATKASVLIGQTLILLGSAWPATEEMFLGTLVSLDDGSWGSCCTLMLCGDRW